MRRVFTKDGTLDEILTFQNDAVVLVPKGYHVVSAPPGYDRYYVNVMTGRCASGESGTTRLRVVARVAAEGRRG